MRLGSVLKKGDLGIFCLILFLAGGISLLLFRPEAEKKDCVIYQNNAIIKTVPLSADSSEEIEITGNYHLVVEIKGNEVRVKESDCPNGVCMSTGWISKPGQVILCAPNRVLIQIVSNKEGEVDGIVY